LKDSDPIHKATVIPRGRALGMVMRLPEEDRFSVTRAKLLADMAVAMGGRVAEEMIFGYDYVTSGASSDIQQVTNIARSMVTKWGLSDKVGHINYAGDETNQYLGGGSKSDTNISNDTAKVIDEEIKRLSDEAYEKAKQILSDKAEDLHKLAKALLEYETLTGDEIKKLLAGEEISHHLNVDANISTSGRSFFGSMKGKKDSTVQQDKLKDGKKDSD